MNARPQWDKCIEPKQYHPPFVSIVGCMSRIHPNDVDARGQFPKSGDSELNVCCVQRKPMPCQERTRDKREGRISIKGESTILRSASIELLLFRRFFLPLFFVCPVHFSDSIPWRRGVPHGACSKLSFPTACVVLGFCPEKGRVGEARACYCPWPQNAHRCCQPATVHGTNRSTLRVWCWCCQVPQFCM